MWSIEEKKSDKVPSEVTLDAMIHEISRNDWQYVKPASWQEIQNLADQMAALCAEISAFAGARGANGCGDHGYEEAMKEATRMRKKVRKALGYSYP